MSDTKRFKIGRWTLTLLARERLSLRAGEIKCWISRGGEVVDGRETPYRSHDVFVMYWTRGSWARDRFELMLRVSNGEMAGVSLRACVPLLGSVYLKLGAPRRLIKPWVLDGRDLGIVLGSYHGVEIRLAYEDDHMRSYYRDKIKRGEDRPEHVGRFALVRGVKLGFSRERFKRLLFGKPSVSREVEETGTTEVPMPEGRYPATWKRERLTWRRSRVPVPLRSRVSVSLDIKPGIPVPGKGENSWDIDDDAICGTGGSTVADAVGNAVAAAQRERMNHAGKGWVPDEGWPLAATQEGRNDG